MGFKCGIIGLPNVGKSTLFNTLTKANVEVANFPFCTIKPNIGLVPIYDPRLDQLSKIVKPMRILPTTIEFIDVAGLVKGASNGKGLGNQFLTNIRNTEAICHVVRCFEDENIIHIAGRVNPAEDIDVINTEIILSDLDICERAIYRVAKKAKSGDKNSKAELLVLEKCLLQLESSAGMLRFLNLNEKEKELIRYLKFLTLKPTMYIANYNKNGFKDNPHLDTIYSIAKKEGSIMIPVCASIGIEGNAIGLNNEKYDEFVSNKFGLEKFDLNYMIHTSFTLLNLQTYFTVGLKEVRAWSIPVGTTALQAAGKIHTDFEKGFIRAKTISFEDFITYNGEKGAKEAGKIREEGKNYIVKDGDIIHFLFNI